MIRVIDTITLGCSSKSGDLATATVVSALIGAGGAAYSANEAADAQDEATRKAEEARRLAEERRKQQAADTRPEGEEATLLPGAADEFGDEPGTYNDFLTPRTVTALGGTSTSGVAGGSSTGLGFNV